MSIDSKIAELLEESKLAETINENEESAEEVVEEGDEEGDESLNEAQARYSDSYKFTHYPGDPESEKKLADLKASVKGTNKRVVLQGRLGKNNPNAYKYSKFAPPEISASSGTHTHDRIRTADAAHHDVYVYNKEEFEQLPEEIKEMYQSDELSVDVSEDVAALINGEELTEEFKTKAATIFEAAVVTRVKQEVAKLEEQFDSRLEEQVESIKEGLIEKVDGYLNYIVEQWISDNELALESGMKNEILESFIAGMKGLFEQHYIEMPEEKFDVLGDLQEQVESVESKLNEQLEANVALAKEINEMKRASAISEFSNGMTDTDAEKFTGLAEELAFEDVDSFKVKLQTIKENYFGKKQNTVVESIITDAPVQLNEDAPAVTGAMAHYLRAINGNK